MERKLIMLTFTFLTNIFFNQMKLVTKKVSKPKVVKKIKVVKKPLNKKLQKQLTLTDAINYDKYDIVELLLKQGHEVKKLTTTYFMGAVSFKMMKLLFEYGLDPNKMKTIHGNSKPLLFECDDLEIVKLAVETYGAVVNIKWKGHTPLYEHERFFGTNIIPVYNYLVSKGAVSK